MWGTYILDAFGPAEAGEVRDALEELLGPRSGSAWRGGGVYVFWEPLNREPLYVGISGDLPLRFAQHLGLRSAPSEGCRREQIAAYFQAGADRIGYTAIPISNLNPISTARQRAVLGLEERELIELNEALSAEALNEVRTIEGWLIASNEVLFGAVPRWNRDPARVPRRAPGLADLTLRTAVGVEDSLLQARLTIRGLLAEPGPGLFEEHLHAARMLSLATAPGASASCEEAIRREVADPREDSAGIYAEILRCGYLDRRCPLSLGPRR
jgi:hypothetical protein